MHPQPCAPLLYGRRRSRTACPPIARPSPMVRSAAAEAVAQRLDYLFAEVNLGMNWAKTCLMCPPYGELFPMLRAGFPAPIRCDCGHDDAQHQIRDVRPEPHHQHPGQHNRTIDDGVVAGKDR